MHSKRKPIVTIIVLLMTFALSFSVVNHSMISYADETTKVNEEEPAPEPTTKNDPVTQTTQPKPADPTTASSVSPLDPGTTKAGDESTTKKPDISDIFNPTTATTAPPSTSDKPAVSEKENSEQHSEKESSGSTTKQSGSTTKKNSNNTTTKKNRNYTTAYYNPAPVTAPKMTVPHVDNTEVSGSTLSPMDAYFERISGDTSTEPFSIVAEETELTTEQTERNLSTTGIVAICLVAIGVLVCVLTLIFAMRNKRANAAGGGRRVEYDDEYEDPSDYDGGEESYDDSESYAPSATQVDQSSQFTVVSLDDKDYKD